MKVKLNRYVRVSPSPFGDDFSQLRHMFYEKLHDGLSDGFDSETLKHLVENIMIHSLCSLCMETVRIDYNTWVTGIILEILQKYHDDRKQGKVPMLELGVLAMLPLSELDAKHE